MQKFISGKVRRTRGRDTGAIYFVWDSNQWKRISHDKFPAASEWNLLLQTTGGSTAIDPQGLITLADKTTGQWNDLSLRLEQMHLGWKRFNESYARREGCKRWGPPLAGEPENIFLDDGKNTCQP